MNLYLKVVFFCLKVPCKKRLKSMLVSENNKTSVCDQENDILLKVMHQFRKIVFNLKFAGNV